MPAQWTAALIGHMHLKGVTAKELAEKVGWNPNYLSTVLNGHRKPKYAEETLTAALEALLSEREEADAALQPPRESGGLA